MAEQAALLERDGIDYAIVPGVTAAFAAAAAARASFTVPEATQTLIITRLAGRTPVPEAERLRDLARHGCSLAVYLSAGDPEGLQEELLAADLPPDTPVVAAPGRGLAARSPGPDHGGEPRDLRPGTRVHPPDRVPGPARGREGGGPVQAVRPGVPARIPE